MHSHLAFSSDIILHYMPLYTYKYTLELFIVRLPSASLIKCLRGDDGVTSQIKLIQAIRYKVSDCRQIVIVMLREPLLAPAGWSLTPAAPTSFREWIHQNSRAIFKQRSGFSGLFWTKQYIMKYVKQFSTADINEYQLGIE